MSKYIAVIESHSTAARYYGVDSSSAMQAAQAYGRCEGGERVTVYRANRNGAPATPAISGVRWTPEDGGKYYRVTV